MLNFITEKIRWWPKIWFTSDLHFAHKNVISYCNRPFQTVEEMNNHIVNYWNKTVKPFDTIFVLGDFSLNKKWSRDLIPKLKGRKILVAGNHDECHISHRKSKTQVETYVKHGWEAVYSHNVFIKLKTGSKIQLCHLPYAPTNPLYDVRYLSLRPNKESEILLHGHSHGMYKKADGMIDVGYDAHGGKFLTEDDVLKLIEDKRDYIPSPLTEYYKNNSKILKHKADKEV